MRAAYLPEWDAYIRCHDLPGEDPAGVYRGVGRCELIGHSMGGSVAILVAGERPELVTRLVIAEANLDPGPGPMTGAIIQHSERDYIDRVYAEDVAAQQKRARDSGSPLLGVVLGMYQVSAPSAIYRSSHSLVHERKRHFASSS